ncbi:dihydrolipoamide acetyltransferase family protein [Sulfurimonas sp.]
MYEIVMPQLSDSMDEGKLISWKKRVGEHVNIGDVIAEVESDKAIMEVQSFKAGTLAEIEVQEGAEAPVGTVIAKIDTGATDVKEEQKSATAKEEQKPLKKELEKPTEQVKPKPEKTKVQQVRVPKPLHKSDETQRGISPKARAKASSLGVSIDEVMKKTANKTVHAVDVEAYAKERYFTPKALQLLHTYKLESSLFNLDHKIESDEVKAYIDEHEIPLPKVLTSMQKAIITNVSGSAKKPIFHLYETLDATLFEKHKEHSITVWLVKIFAKVMMKHETFRSHLHDDAISVAPNASISLAVANEKDLYMPVIKDANKLSASGIQEQLNEMKIKLQSSSFTPKDMQGSTFGISNLGMLGVERFDAMINKDDAAIIAIGTINNGKISVTLTADHRLINGYEAGLFMRDVKYEAQNPLNFKEE